MTIVMAIKKPGIVPGLDVPLAPPHNIINAETAVLVPAYLRFPGRY